MHAIQHYLAVSFLITVFVIIPLVPKKLFSEGIRAGSENFIVIYDWQGVEGIPQAAEKQRDLGDLLTAYPVKALFYGSL